MKNNDSISILGGLKGDASIFNPSFGWPVNEHPLASTCELLTQGAEAVKERKRMLHSQKLKQDASDQLASKLKLE